MNAGRIHINDASVAANCKAVVARAARLKFAADNRKAIDDWLDDESQKRKAASESPEQFRAYVLSSRAQLSPLLSPEQCSGYLPDGPTLTDADVRTAMESALSNHRRGVVEGLWDMARLLHRPGLPALPLDLSTEARAKSAWDDLVRWIDFQTSPAAEQPKKRRAEAASAVEALLDEAGREILRIVNSDVDSDTKMREICRIDRTRVHWNSPQWGDLLGVTADAIRQTKFWRVDRKKAIEALKEMAGD